MIEQKKVSWEEYQDAIDYSNKLLETLSKSGMKDASDSLSITLSVILGQMKNRLGE